MRIKLVLLDSFESDFNDLHYFIYQFIDSATLHVISHSSTSNLGLVIGKEYDCVLGLKRNKLIVSQVAKN